MTVDGDLFVGWPFSAVLPSQGGDTPPKAVIEISNVDREITERLEPILEPIDITLCAGAGRDA